jgi:hypothetical protein
MCTLLNGLAALMLARASLPQRLQASLSRVQAEVDAMGKSIEDFARQATTNESVIRSLVEEAEHAFDRAERKRSSVAATASRAKAREAEEPAAPQSRAEIINRMRQVNG